MSDHLELMRNLALGMNQGSPQALALKLETLSIDRDGSVLKVPYDEKLIGDPETGVIAGGVVTTLLDHACGQAVHAAMTEFKTIATLDLRIDYMRPAEPGKDIFAKAHCYKATRSVAFVRAVAYDDSPDDPVAAAQAAFMLDSSAGRGFGANLKPRKDRK
ncbi:PaaI family thioesterase [Caulobacter mirabilis]|uniref:Thioesterase n=1 Tax=Caulobacter mirabilis TaxID=69666 RepID=A0A2D2AT73_9CAUL|nr:PaaI family thioesterase [Caulobacter mirabilis]ATQ41167.1 thioesterase [Caulobacter mirabilis]